MQIFKLNNFQYPGDTIQDFDSLAWTERYQTAGDFQLVIDNNVSVLDFFPIGALISHTDTTEVMIVENHEIVRNSKKDLKITISGRSFETFSENRITYGSDRPLADPTSGVTNPDLTFTMSSSELTALILQRSLQPGIALVEDSIPNLIVELNMRVSDSPMDYVLKRSDVYSRVLEFLPIDDTGIKIVRPNGNQTSMNVVIHDGLDKSDSIIFYAQNEDLDDAKYFWSNKGYKNYAQVDAHIYARLYRHKNLASDLNGLERRVLYVEVDDLKDNYDPPSLTDVISAVGQSALDEDKQTSLLQATISITAKPKFKFDYDIGDIVTVFGEFSIAQTMRVTEHILTVDKAGMRGYPSLTSI